MYTDLKISYDVIIMLLYILLSLFIATYSFVPDCSKCKFFINNKDNIKELGQCKLFPETSNLSKSNIMIHNFAMHCRNNENLCGKKGFLYEPITTINNIEYDYNELNNRCCGEVNEKQELEQLEKDFSEIMQKIKKYNTKRIYKDA